MLTLKTHLVSRFIASQAIGCTWETNWMTSPKSVAVCLLVSLETNLKKDKNNKKPEPRGCPQGAPLTVLTQPTLRVDRGSGPDPDQPQLRPYDTVGGPGSQSAMQKKTVVGVSQSQWHHFGWQVSLPPILEPFFSGDWDVHWGYGLLTHGHMAMGHNLWLHFGADENPCTT